MTRAARITIAAAYLLVGAASVLPSRPSPASVADSGMYDPNTGIWVPNWEGYDNASITDQNPDQTWKVPPPKRPLPQMAPPAPVNFEQPSPPAQPAMRKAVTLRGGTAYTAGELPLPFTPADMWAYTVLADRPLPPAEYDHPYQGPVVVFQADNQADMKTKCNRPDVPGRAAPFREL
jgi:hypothetical protein